MLCGLGSSQRPFPRGTFAQTLRGRWGGGGAARVFARAAARACTAKLCSFASSGFPAKYRSASLRSFPNLWGK